MIRVLVVEDSVTVRKRLHEVLAADPEFEVVGEAGNGKQAIELCQAFRPDVVTMDMMMPVMSGLAATEFIMAHCPTPILVVSSSTNRGELFKTYDALAAGAVDVLEKPDGDEPGGHWEARFIDSVKMVARIRVITHLRARLGLPAAFIPQPAQPEAQAGTSRPPSSKSCAGYRKRCARPFCSCCTSTSPSAARSPSGWMDRLRAASPTRRMDSCWRLQWIAS